MVDNFIKKKKFNKKESELLKNEFFENLEAGNDTDEFDLEFEMGHPTFADSKSEKPRERLTIIKNLGPKKSSSPYAHNQIVDEKD